MSAQQQRITAQDIHAILLAAPFSYPRWGRAVLWLMVLTGAVFLVLRLFGPEPRLAWLSLQVNFIYWFSLAAASTCFSAVLFVSGGRWARPIQRLFESASPFLSASAVILLFLYCGRTHLFIWATEQIGGKGRWLEPWFVYLRDVAAISLLAYAGYKIVYYSLRRDLGAIRSGMTDLEGRDLDRWLDPSFSGIVKGWSGDGRAALDAVNCRLSRLSPLVIIAYALILSLLAFDQVMSVDPYWQSTLFGVFVFMSAVYLAIAWIAVLQGIVREEHPLFRRYITPDTLHDIGKLMLGFGIFWAYLFWSHYLTIWYANMPEETGWVIIRLRLEPWHSFAWLTFGCAFVVPFFLGLSRDVKRTPALLSATGTIAAVGMWLQFYLLFTPSLYPKAIPLDFDDLFIALSFFAAFLLSVIAFLGRYPLMPFGDLFLTDQREA